jgi:hypothetical protein
MVDLPTLRVLALLLHIDPTDPDDADDLETLGMLLASRVLREPPSDSPPDRPRLRVVR